MIGIGQKIGSLEIGILRNATTRAVLVFELVVVHCM
jgi:hypothetical protein